MPNPAFYAAQFLPLPPHTREPADGWTRDQGSECIPCLHVDPAVRGAPQLACIYCSTGYRPFQRGSQRAESRLLLRPIPPDDIRNTTAIAKKLHRSVVIEEHFEFAIRDAHTVKRTVHYALCDFRHFRHTAAIVNTA